MTKELDAVVTQLLAEAQMAFTTSDTPADLKQSADALRALLHEWYARHKRVETTVIGLLQLVQSRCEHVGAATGYNQRDGSWMAPCPTCGASR